MPAGIVKTPKSNGSGGQKSAERSSSNGKKFVQTRLPFKLIAPTGAAASSAAASASAATSSGASEAANPSEMAVEVPRKRKLSYEDETEAAAGSGAEAGGDHLRRSNSKENLDLTGAAVAPKKAKTGEAPAVEEIIELDDDDVEAAVEAKPGKGKEQQGKAKKGTAKGAPKERAGEAGKARDKSSPAPPIQIKLPLNNKRLKRRKSLKKAEETEAGAGTGTGTGSKASSESSDEIEVLAVELNPQKRSKKEQEDVAVAEEEPESSSKAEPHAAKAETKAEPAKAKGKPRKEAEAKEASPLAEEEPESVSKAEPHAAEAETKKEPAKAKGKPRKEEASPPQEATKGGGNATANETEDEDKTAAEVSVILSTSEGEHSSSDHEMELDTDTPAARTSVEKEAAARRSLPEAAVSAEKALTPKQLKLMEQRKKAREEKEQKLAEERRLKQLEKEQREQQRKQEREEKEQQRKLEKDQKEQQRRQEREEKERKRQAEADSKNEEKRKRNEAKEEVQRKKDEERRKKEQEREEAEQKKKRAAESFSKFFVPKQPKSGSGSGAASCLEHEQSSCDSTKASSQTLAFRPFQVKDDMLLAPVVRANLGQEQRSQLDTLFRQDSDGEQEDEDIGRRKPPGRAHLYLNELSSGRRQPLAMSKDSRLQRRVKDDEDEDEVQVIGRSLPREPPACQLSYALCLTDELCTAGLPIEEEQPKQVARLRAKYLHFADNRRPPYYGTWRKKSRSICARRPLALDKQHFDYELDSDCEWEEEEPGESLSASEDEKERESEEESEEEYNEWYVPHGHLSDEELQNDGDEMDDGHTREAQKAKLQVLQQEFAREMKKQTKKIKPRLLGPVWLDENGNKSDLFPAMFVHTIDTYACWQLGPLSLEPPPEPEREDQAPEPPMLLQLDERLLQQLVRLTHGNRNSKAFLINEYLAYLKTQASCTNGQGVESAAVLPSKTVIREKFDELAAWKPVELGTPEAASTASSGKKAKKPKKRLCWVVAPEMLAKFQLPELSLQNQWDYTLTPKVTEGSEAQPHELSPPAEAATGDVAASPATGAPVASPAPAPATPTTPVVKKRATLLSVPRDQSTQSVAKNALISTFLRRQGDLASKDSPGKTGKPKGAVPDPIVTDVVLLSD
ncbi:hypothetical protein KR018_007413 [Drosophila ironensis]|nr:hypothetical protein KR018_007413 [Drosophila ironensis]